MAPLIFDLDLDALKALLESWGEPAYRALQVWQGLYRQLWQSPDQFSNLPARLRQRIAAEINFQALQLLTSLHSTDRRTEKALFRLQDGKAVEAVLMRYDRRQTLCISTQVGCAMGCVFCATGQMGFGRNLTSGEIVGQVLFFAGKLQAEGSKVTNVVIMGMGEPFHNYESTMQAIDRLNDPDGLNLGARRFTVSTSGLIPGIQRLAAERRQINLAVSLHAADDPLRESMMPVNRRYPIAELLAACREYVAATGRRISFEWALIDGVNDTPEMAHQLGERLQGLLCHVNAIPLNPTAGYAGTPTSPARAEVFKSILERAGIPCTIRVRRGIDIGAGCGQLAVLERHIL